MFDVRLKKRILEAIREGNTPEVSQLFREFTGDNDPIDAFREVFLYWIDYVEFNTLGHAASKGDETFAKLLLEHQVMLCEENPELQSSHLEYCHRALNDLVKRGNNDAVAILLKVGVDVNTTTDGPGGQHALFFAHKYSTAEILISRGARVDIPNSVGETCLFNACRNVNDAVARLLLRNGADPNHKSYIGETPLHVASRHSQSIVELLLQCGAVMTKNEDGLTPVMEAALWPSAECVEYFLTLPELTREEKLDAMEVLGAGLVHMDPEKAHIFLEQAMDERYRDHNNVLAKPQRLPAHELGNVRESQNPEELESRRHNRPLFQMEAVLVLERILGRENNRFGWKCFDICDHLLQQGNPEDALAVWNRPKKFFRCTEYSGLGLQYPISSQIGKIVDGMVHKGLAPFAGLLQGLQMTTSELEGEASAVQDGANSTPNSRSILVFIEHTRMALEAVTSADDLKQLEELVSRLITALKTLQHPFVLHEAYWQADRVVQTHDGKKEITDSFVSLFDLLLKCGADVDEKSDEETVLHYIVEGSGESKLGQLICRLARRLLEAGAHMDARNGRNETPLDIARSDEVKAVLLEHCTPRLVCLAASAVVQNGIAYQGVVPSAVEKFIKIHDFHH